MQRVTPEELQGMLRYYSELLERYERVLAGTPQSDPLYHDHCKQYYALLEAWKRIPKLP